MPLQQRGPIIEPDTDQLCRADGWGVPSAPLGLRDAAWRRGHEDIGARNSLSSVRSISVPRVSSFRALASTDLFQKPESPS